MKGAIRISGLALAADAVGFDSINDCRTARCPNPNTILPGVTSITALGGREAHRAVGDIRRFPAASPENRKKLLVDPQFPSLRQASFIGFSYNGFRCSAPCPACP